MGLLSEIKNLEQKYTLLYVSAFFGTIASGFLIIFHFRPELIEKYDILKLSFLSLALTMPFVLVNIIIAILYSSNLEKEYKDWQFIVTGAALLFNATIIYQALLVCYLFSLTFKWFLIMTALWEFSSFVFGILIFIGRRKKRNANSV